ncbi:MAG: thioredoxin family protein [Desulfuromonadales bacterium]|nr:thioredoxin family protein [Desulfuromonadales bacterium]
MRIEIYGDGCNRCDALKRKTERAVRELGLDVEIRAVMDPEHPSELHALSLPQLVVNGHHHADKTAMSVAEIKDYLRTFD